MAIVLDGTNGINTTDLESAGPVSGTTGTFSGAVQASGVATNIYPLVSATAVTASGTSVDFTGIPSWVKRITVMFSGVSTNGSSDIVLQVGDGAIVTTGYVSSFDAFSSTPNTQNITSAFGLFDAMSAASTIHAVITLVNITGNTWVEAHTGSASNPGICLGAGSKTLSGTLDRVRITTVNGTDTFDAGTINIMYEG